MFQNPNSALETVDLSFSSIDNDTLVSLANSLVQNNKPKGLFLERDGYGEYVAISNWDALLNVLCNKSSISATFNSNHTFQKISEYNDIEESYESLLIYKHSCN